MKNVQTEPEPFGVSFSKYKSFFLLLLLVYAALSFAHRSTAEEKNEVAEIIRAYGGKDALSRVSALTAEGKITTFMPEDKGTYFLYLKRSGKLLVDIKYTKRTEKRILNGDKGYSGTDEKVAEVTGPSYNAMVYQYDQLDLPYGLLDSAFGVRYVKKDRLRERTVDVLGLIDRSGNEMDIAVDSETHFIVKTSGSFMMGGEKAVLSSEFRDFRKVGGIELPFTLVNYADGFKISETRITKYTVNPDIGDSVFSP